MTLAPEMSRGTALQEVWQVLAGHVWVTWTRVDAQVIKTLQKTPKPPVAQLPGLDPEIQGDHLLEP